MVSKPNLRSDSHTLARLKIESMTVSLPSVILFKYRKLIDRLPRSYPVYAHMELFRLNAFPITY
jgi:hypothetical protein